MHTTLGSSEILSAAFSIKMRRKVFHVVEILSAAFPNKTGGKYFTYYFMEININLPTVEHQITY